MGANWRNLSAEEDPAMFPAPLVLPGDDLAEDPEWPPQNFQQWEFDEDRNEVTAERNVVYVVPPPQIDADVDFMRKWTTPRSCDHEHQTSPPTVEDVCDYLAAFFHGLPVKSLPQTTLHFMPWEQSRKPSTSRKPKYLGLRLGDECVRIRVRACPDSLYERQLNLDDLLDAAINMLPSDAYALLLLVDHDLYEDDEDSFVCGRAYGGSRVAVVSSARYNPDLDDMQSIERVHAWPASHCEDYVSLCCSSLQPSSKRQKESNATETKLHPNPTHSLESTSSPMEAAVSAYRALSAVDPSPSSLSALWLGRVCRTASHELSHCFGLDHCVYYACVMQGTASISEDARQPPYLCPVDSAKMVRATKTNAVSRYAALLAFCERPGNENTPFFAPLSAWIRSIPDELKC